MADDPTSTDVPPVETTSDVDKWKAHSRKNESEKKAALQQIADLTAKLSDTEAKVSNLESSGKTAIEDLKKSFATAAAAERAKMHATYAAKARGADADALLEGRDIKPFLKEDGAVNEDAITQWLDKVAPTRAPVTYGGGNPGTGSSGDPNDKYANDDLAKLLKEKLGF